MPNHAAKGLETPADDDAKPGLNAAEFQLQVEQKKAAALAEKAKAKAIKAAIAAGVPSGRIGEMQQGATLEEIEAETAAAKQARVDAAAQVKADRAQAAADKKAAAEAAKAEKAAEREAKKAAGPSAEEVAAKAEAKAKADAARAEKKAASDAAKAVKDAARAEKIAAEQALGLDDEHLCEAGNHAAKVRNFPTTKTGSGRSFKECRACRDARVKAAKEAVSA